MQGLKQELRLRQELTLQPQQILRSELIQMPLLELEMRVRAELEENPFLEEAEDSGEDEALPEQSDSEDSPSAALLDSEEESESDIYPVSEKNNDIDWEEIYNDSSQWEYRAQTRLSSVEENVDLPQTASTSLYDKLIEQLYLDTLTEQERSIGEEIIGNIDNDGRLPPNTLEDIASKTGVPLQVVEKVHQHIMSYDPVGIAARSLKECLLVQLQNRTPRYPVVERMISECWDDFINKRYEIIQEKLQITLEDIKNGFEVISKLNPKPGEGHFDEKQNYIIPDLIVTQVGGKYEIFLNDGDIPSFRINPAYREMFLSQVHTDKKVREFLNRKLESARWFINAIHQRRTTMLRTMRAILERQMDFFRKGPQYLKPMILADIAEDVGMDVSTISRVTSGKYVQTDWGVFELKYFFSEAMDTDEGEEVSNRVIKERLKELIASENKKEPLSDQELTDILNKEGFQIKRRTVAKYREMLRIPVKRLRREI